MQNTKWGPFNGDLWEEMMQVILKSKYADSGYQNMPALPNGDFGLEGFTRTGDAFQCYCPAGDYDNKTLYEKVRDKISEDIPKLEKNESTLIGKLGGVIIQRWILVTPKSPYNNILDHATKKRKEMRDKSLKILNPEFDILIWDGDYFSAEIQEYINRRTGKISYSESDSAFRFVNDPHDNIIAGNIDTKSRKIETVESRINRRKAQFQSDLIAGDELFRKIEKGDPITFQLIRRCIDQVERELTFILLSYQDDNSVSLIIKLKALVEERIEKDLPTLSVNEKSQISLYAISRWISFCPLDFEV